MCEDNKEFHSYSVFRAKLVLIFTYERIGWEVEGGRGVNSIVPAGVTVNVSSTERCVRGQMRAGESVECGQTDREGEPVTPPQHPAGKTTRCCLTTSSFGNRLIPPLNCRLNLSCMSIIRVISLFFSAAYSSSFEPYSIRIMWKAEKLSIKYIKETLWKEGYQLAQWDLTMLVSFFLVSLFSTFLFYFLPWLWFISGYYK